MPPWADLAAYVVILGAAAAVPGPDIAAITARSLSAEARSNGAFILGIILGHGVWTLAAALGLAALIAALGPAFIVVKIAAAAYLLWLAWSLWRAGPAPPELAPPRPGQGGRALAAGLLVSLSNPKAVVVFGSILPTVLPLDRLSPAGLAVVVLASSLTLGVVFAVWAVAASRARRWLTRGSHQRLLNRISAGLLAAAGVAVVAR